MYQPARETMADEGVSDVAVPTSTYYLTWKALDPATVTLALRERGQVVQALRHPRRGAPRRHRQGQLGRRQARPGHVQRRAGLARPLLRRRRSRTRAASPRRTSPSRRTLMLPGGRRRHHQQEASIATIASGQDAGRHHHRVRHPHRGAEQGGHAQGHRRPGQGRARRRPTTSATYKILLQLQ